MKKIVIILFTVIFLFSCTRVRMINYRTISPNSEGEPTLYVIGVESHMEYCEYYLNTKASAADTVLVIMHRATRLTPFPKETYEFGDKLVLKKVD